MTRVLVMEASGNLWGSERALLDLIDHMPTIELAVCCPPNRPLLNEFAKRQIRVFPHFVYGLHEKSRWSRLWAVFSVLRACLAFRPDVIYLNQSGSYRVVMPTARLMNLPIVAHIRIFEDAAYLARQHPSKARLNSLIAISKAIEYEIRSFKELDTIPVHCIYDAYASRYKTRSPVVSQSISNRVACVGRLVSIKGQDILIRAVSLLKKSGFHVECLFAGDGQADYCEELKELVLSLDVSSSIQWLGFADDVISKLRTCRVLVCPSQREPLGRVIFEAWDAGAIPIVFAGSGGGAEIVADSGGGLLYNQQSPDCLARVLKGALALEDGEQARLVDNGRSWMAKNCNPETYGEAFAAILSGACASHPVDNEIRSP